MLLKLLFIALALAAGLIAFLAWIAYDDKKTLNKNKYEQH